MASLASSRQGARAVGENRQVRVLLVEVLERVANRLHAATHLAGDPPRDLRRRAPGPRQPTGALHDLPAVLIGQLAEPLAAPHLLAVVVHKTIHAPLQETHTLAALKQEPTADQALLRQREIVLVDTLNILLSSSTV